MKFLQEKTHSQIVISSLNVSKNIYTDNQSEIIDF